MYAQNKICNGEQGQSNKFTCHKCNNKKGIKNELLLFPGKKNKKNTTMATSIERNCSGSSNSSKSLNTGLQKVVGWFEVDVQTKRKSLEY